jgi:hypothetical protein
VSGTLRDLDYICEQYTKLPVLMELLWKEPRQATDATTEGAKGATVFNEMARVGLGKKVMSEQRPEGAT